MFQSIVRVQRIDTLPVGYQVVVQMKIFQLWKRVLITARNGGYFVSGQIDLLEAVVVR